MNLQDRRAVWLGGQMLKAVGHEWQADVTYDAFAVVRSPVNGQLYRSLAGSNLGNEPSVSGSQWALGVSQNSDLLNTARVDVASASTVNLTTSAPNTRNIRLTGTATVNQFTVAAGQRYLVQVGGSLTIANNSNIVTNSGANLSLVAGDSFEIVATAANVVSVALLSTGQTFTQSLAANGWQRLPSGLILQWGKTTVSALDTNVSVVLPVSFPNSALNASVSTENSAGNNTADAQPGIISLSTTTLVLRSMLNGTGQTVPSALYWFAIGF
jgi:hypothetical protein